LRSEGSHALHQLSANIVATEAKKWNGRLELIKSVGPYVGEWCVLNLKECPPFGEAVLTYCRGLGLCVMRDTIEYYELWFMIDFAGVEKRGLLDATPSSKPRNKTGEYEAKVVITSKLRYFSLFKEKLNENRRKLFRKSCFGKWLDISFYDNEPHFIDYILQKQVFVDDAHYDMPLVYNVEGRFLHFGRPEFSLITGLHFGTYSFRKFKSGDVTFVSRVLPHKLGLKVSNLDLLGLIEDEELFGKLVDDDAVRVCLLLALEVIFIGKKLVDEVPDTLMRLVENLVVWNDFRWGEYIWRHLYDQIMNVVNKNKWEHLKGLSKSRNYVPTYTLSGFVWSFKDSQVNLDLTPTISEQQTFWYMDFHKFYMSYIPRSPPTTYTDLFDDYMKKLSSTRKRGKIDTRDLPIIRRRDTTSVEEIRLKDGVITKLNSRVLSRERKGVSLDKSCVVEFFNNFRFGCWEELNEEFNELCETKFCVNGPAMIDLYSDEDLVMVM
ncbi:phospholipase-like protein, partial [Tanacetum coccineum]